MDASAQLIAVNDDLEHWARVYVKSFLASYWKYGGPASQSVTHLILYADAIQENAEKIGKEAAELISNYVNRYNVGTEESVDEYKLIYFLGRAIEKNLPDFESMRGTHLFTMIGLLDFRLQKLGIFKPQLVNALTTQIRTGVFDAELGFTGCYLIYKCVSTTTKGTPPEEAAPALKGTGLDQPKTATDRALGAGL